MTFMCGTIIGIKVTLPDSLGDPIYVIKWNLCHKMEPGDQHKNVQIRISPRKQLLFHQALMELFSEYARKRKKQSL